MTGYKKRPLVHNLGGSKPTTRAIKEKAVCFFKPTLILPQKGGGVKTEMKIKTKDLWQSAYMLSKGSNLDDVKINSNGNGKREVVFTLTGEDTGELMQEFLSGQAICNVSRLRASMIHLKDQMFRLIR